MILNFLDIETTGLSQEKGHRIIEVAMFLCDLDGERPLGQFVQRINPQRSIDPDAQAVHGIAFTDLTECPVWEEVAPKLVKIIGKSDLLIAHNGDGFDLPFIGMELMRIGQPVPNVKSLDTMVSGRWATPMGKLPSLKELCFATGIEYDPEKAHAALYDVQVMAQAFFVGHRKGFFQIEQDAHKEAA